MRRAVIIAMLAMWMLPGVARGQDTGQPPQEERSRRKLWTGVGLTLGGAVFFAQSKLYFPDGCGSYNDACRSERFAFQFVGGALTIAGVTLIIADRADARRRTRVALGIAPRTVRLSVNF